MAFADPLDLQEVDNAAGAAVERQGRRLWRLMEPQADAILDQAMAACGVPPWRRAVIWTAVRLGGAGGWGC